MVKGGGGEVLSVKIGIGLRDSEDRTGFNEWRDQYRRHAYPETIEIKTAIVWAIRRLFGIFRRWHMIISAAMFIVGDD